MARPHGKRSRRAPNRSATRRSGTSREHDRTWPDPETEPLIRGLRAVLRSDHPAVFVAQAAAVADLALAPPEDAPWEGDLLQSFLDVDIAETTGLLHVIAALTDDVLQRTRIRRVLARRIQPLPQVVREVERLTVPTAYLMTEELEESSNVLLGLQWPDGTAQSLVLLIDHARDSIVRGALLVPLAGPEAVALYRDLNEQEGHTLAFEEIAPAQAARRLRAAVDAWLASPYREGLEALSQPDDGEAVDEWPILRPFLELALRVIPPSEADGGLETDADVTAMRTDAGVRADAVGRVLEVFFSSPEGLPFAGDTDATGLAENVLQLLGARYGDPQRLSPATVQLLLDEGLPWGSSVTADEVARVPDVLPALIRHAHRLRGISAGATEATVAEVRHGAAELLATVTDPDWEDERIDAQELAFLAAGGGMELIRGFLADCVGGPEALAALDAAPLPDDPLDLGHVREDVRGALREVSAHVDRLVDEGPWPELDVEFRTACRRYLVAAAMGDPEVFRRRASTERTAACVVWNVGRANELIGYGPVRTKDVLAWFGVKGHPTSRADAIHAALGVPSPLFGLSVGSPTMLTSAARRQIIERRDGGRF